MHYLDKNLSKPLLIFLCMDLFEKPEKDKNYTQKKYAYLDTKLRTTMVDQFTCFPFI